MKKIFFMLLVLVSTNVMSATLTEMTAESLSSKKAISGYIEGNIAENIKRTTRSQEPVYATVEQIQSFAKNGCSRMRMNIKQENVPTRDGRLVPFSIDFEFDTCFNSDVSNLKVIQPNGTLIKVPLPKKTDGKVK